MVARKNDGRITTWTSGQSPPAEVHDWVHAGMPIVAHNAMHFDRLVWDSLGWPQGIWIDTLHLARLVGLPGKLDDLAWELLGLHKDVDGRKLTLALSRTGADGHLPPVSPEVLKRVVAYCRRDVELLARIWQSLCALRDTEAAIRAVDLRINDRGFFFDAELAAGIVECHERAVAERRQTAPVSEEVLSSPAQLRAWLNALGVDVPDVQKATLNAVLEDETISEEVRQAIEARLVGAGIIEHKLRAALRRAGSDGRVRDTLNFYGAHTGRWSGAGFQPQNLPRGAKINAEASIQGALARDLDRLRELAAEASVPVEDVLSSLVRRCVRAPPGRRLAVVDFAQVEARALLWLAGDEEGLGPFRAGQDKYKVMAATVFCIDLASVDDEGPERRLGKSLVLGCGYSLGPDGFRERAEGEGIDWSSIGITPSEAVEAWRDAHPLVAGYRVGFRQDGGVNRRGGIWRDLEHAAMRACFGESVEVARTLWERSGDDVVCTLPSGRHMVYRAASVENALMPWDAIKPAFTFSRRGAREHSYGGKLTENVTQAVCRDLHAEALVRLDRKGFDVVLHVHDETVAEVPADGAKAALKAMMKAMKELPAWAEGLPIAVKGYEADRYRK